MINITFINAEGQTTQASAQTGDTLMQVAKRHGVQEVEAQCGGQLMCATCHVYIESSFLSILPAQSDEEIDLLDFSDDVQSNSRLSCQIKLDERFDGLQVELPAI